MKDQKPALPTSATAMVIMCSMPIIYFPYALAIYVKRSPLGLRVTRLRYQRSATVAAPQNISPDPTTKNIMPPATLSA